MKHLPFVAALLFALPGALLLPGHAHATVVSLPSDDELVSRAEVIAVATVTRLETVRNAQGDIHTLAELQVQRGVRGAAAGDFLAVTYPGGTSGPLTSRVAGTPDLKVGQSVFAYLSKRGETYTPIGFRYGVLQVNRGTDGTLRATRSIDGLSFVNRQGDTVEPIKVDNVRIEEMITDINGRMKRLRIDPARARESRIPNATKLPAVRK